MKHRKKIDRSVKKELRKKRRYKKKIQKLKKKYLTTMDWCDLEEVRDDEMILSHGKTSIHVKGVKLTPRNIFLEDYTMVEAIINKLRIAMNKLPFKVFWAFVTSPVNIDDYKTRLYEMSLNTDSSFIRNLIIDDYNKAVEFEERNSELEFMMFVKDKNEKILEKYYQTLLREMANAMLDPKPLTKMDFLHYVSYVFENPLINSIFFSRGVFQFSNEEYSIISNQIQTKAIDSDRWYESANDKTEYVSEEAIKRYKKSKMVPTTFIEHDDYMLIGDKYCCMLLVISFPETYSEGLISGLLNNKDYKVFLTTEKIDVDIAKALRKDTREKMDEIANTNDMKYRHELELAIESNELYVDRIVRNNDFTSNVTLAIMISSESLEDMIQKKTDLMKFLDLYKFMVHSCRGMQEEVFRYVCPILNKGFFLHDIESNYGVPLPSEGVAGLYPFVYETLKDREGFLFGYERSNGGVIIFDPFAYKRPYWTSRHDHQRTNGNMVIVGKSGFGKTVALNMTIRNDIREGFNIIAIDPENKVNKLIKRYGGSSVSYGVSHNIINVFDLRPLSTDEDEEDENYDREKAIEEMWDTNNAINFVIGQVNQVFSFLFNEFTDEEASVLGDLIRAAYHSVNILPDENGKYPSFRHMKSDDMPVFSTVRQILYNVKNRKQSDFKKGIYDKLEVKLNRVCGEWGIYLDGHTSLKFESSDSRKVVAFGTKQLQNVSEQLRTALNHIMYNYAWSLCIDNDEWSSFILDEAHVNILEGAIASLTAQFVRRARKYNTCVRLATQEPRDFADERILTHGKAIFNNSAYKLILHLDKDAGIEASKLMSMNENERVNLINYNIGEALFVCGERRIPIKVWATEKEKKG